MRAKMGLKRREEESYGAKGLQLGGGTVIGIDLHLFFFSTTTNFYLDRGKLV